MNLQEIYEMYREDEDARVQGWPTKHDAALRGYTVKLSHRVTAPYLPSNPTGLVVPAGHVATSEAYRVFAAVAK